MNVSPLPDEAKPVAPARSQVVDIVKGIAILLMVFGHVLQGLMHRGWVTDPTATFANDFIYSFHMPAFFVVAGLFLFSSLDKRGFRVFAIDKSKNILYPYVLWVCIGATSAWLLGPLQPSGMRYDDVRSFVVALLLGSPLWFLYTLFLLQIFAALTRRMADWMRLALGLLMAACVTQYGTPMPDRLLYEFVFIAVGIAIGARVRRLEAVDLPRAGLGLALLAAFQWVAIDRFGAPAPLEGVLLGITGTGGLFLLSRLIDGSAIGRGFAWLGQASLGIFFLSAYGQGFFREFVVRVLHTQAALPQLLIATLGATLIPALLWHAQDRLRIGWLFRFPSRPPPPSPARPEA